MRGVYLKMGDYILGIDQVLKQEQKLALTQTMRQSISILQMPINDLIDYIDKEFEENPVLEGELKESEFQKNNTIENYKEMINYLNSNNYNSGINNYYNEDEVDQFSFISEKKSLKDFLFNQLIEIKIKKDLKKIIRYMIEAVDNNGYLSESIEIISREINVDINLCEQALDILQGFEPLGIASRNLKECLLIQAKRKNILDEYLEKIILDYIEYIAENKYNYISKKIGISEKRVQDYADIIKTLEPKPSRGYYCGEDVNFIIPDAYVVKIGNDYNVILNNGVVPTLRVSDIYVNFINKEKSSLEKKYVEEKIGNAINLIKNINQRNTTLVSVINAIINRQIDYFEKGLDFLKPMTLKDISEDLGFHESTISRAVKDKYIATQNGTIKLKSLFTQKVSNSYYEEEEKSVINIKNKIKDLINKEDKKKPISDQIICNILNEENFSISRRTVAKYREELGIKSSSKRKRI